MRAGILRIFLMLLVLLAVANCAPPVGALRDSAGSGGDTLWQVPKRTMYDTTFANGRFIPSADLLVFVSYNGMVSTVPITQVTVELCKNPNAADPVFESIPNPPPGAANGYYHFQTNGRYLARVVYDGMYSEPYSIQVGSLGNGGGSSWGDDEGIQLLWNPLVIFNSNGGSDVPRQRIIYGEKAVEPSPPTKAGGYTFDGWYRDSGLTVPFYFSEPVTDSITLYAKWL